MALPPGVTEVGRTAAPGGGWWILGSDGGVFSEGATEHFGSYWSEFMAPHRNDPNRAWERIETTEQGGYRIVSTNQEKYEFNPTNQQARTGVTPPPANPTATPPAPTGPSGADADARAVLNEMLSQYGLEGLGDWVWNEYQSTQSTALVQTRLRDRPEYKQRFPAMDLRKQAGLRPLSEQEYIDFENQTKALMRDYELPKGFYDTPDDLTKFLANDVSPQEMQTRIQDGYAAAMNAPQEWRDEASRMFGVGPGGLAAFFLDPDRSTDILMRNWAESQISGEAVRTGFGGLSQDEAARLRSLGISAQSAAERFGTLAQGAQITGQLPGEQDAAMSRESQLGLVANSPSGQEEMRQRQRRRTAAFEGGGSFAGGQGGMSGLGEAG